MKTHQMLGTLLATGWFGLSLAAAPALKKAS